MKAELRGLTGARGVAAWLVVLYHIRAALPITPHATAVLAKGYLAVDFFFVLSGFVIWLSYSDDIRARRWASVPDFLLRRIARIWPLHLVMLAFGVAIAGTLHVTGRLPDPRFDFAALPAHVLLLQAWGGHGALDWNDPAWSISCEMFAYIAFVPLVMLVDWRRTPSAIILTAIGALIAVLAVVMAWHGLHSLGQLIPQFGLLRCVTEFACGTGVAALWARHRDAPARPVLIATAIAAAALAAFATGAVVELASIPLAFAALLFILAQYANAAGNPLASRPIHYLGEISFATYLSHSLLWKAFKLAFMDHPGRQGWPTMLAFAALVLIASIALYHLVERPSQRWVRALPGRLTARGGDRALSTHPR